MADLIPLLVSGPVAFLSCTGLNWLALIPWRKARESHWCEQARILWPIRNGAQTLLWSTPITAALLVKAIRPESTIVQLTVTALFSCLGAFFASCVIDRALAKVTQPLGDTVRQVFVSFAIVILHWFILVFAAALMPAHIGWEMAAVVTGFIFLRVIWSHTGWSWFGRKLGLIKPASARLVAIADASVKRTNSSYRHVWIMRSRSAQAFALTQTGDLLFTERLLELLTDDELASICDHEVGHLNESRSARLIRNLNLFTTAPWIFITPLVSTLGFAGLYIPFLLSFFLARFFNSFSRRMEENADQHASKQQADPRTYAQALLKIHEDNLVPAVYPGKHLSHPHLYDRMLACGVTPDFPRPAAPESMSWAGLLASILLGITVGAFGLKHLWHK